MNIWFCFLITFLLHFNLFGQDPCGILDQIELDKICDNQSRYCLGVPFDELDNYNLTVNGEEYNNDFLACDVYTTFLYVSSELSSGPFIIEEWSINDTIFSSGEIETIIDLVDTLNKWDTTNKWTLELNQNLQLIQSSDIPLNIRDFYSNIPLNIYSELVIRTPSSNVNYNIGGNEIRSVNGVSLLLPTGIHEIQLENKQTNCIDTAIVEVATSPLFQIENLQVSQESCGGNDASIIVQVSGALGAISYKWDNEIGTTQDSILMNITAGNYHVTITDSKRCEELIDSVLVSGALSYNVVSTTSLCDMENGQAAVILNTPINNPTFSWSNGATAQVANNLASDWYSVTVTNDNNCVSHKNIEVKEPDSCFVYISGYVYLDSIAPNCLTGGEFGAKNVKVELSGINFESQIQKTNSNGFYNFKVKSGDYLLSVLTNLEDGYLACPSINQILVSAPTLDTIFENNNFYLQSDLTNLSVTGGSSNPRSNADQYVTINYRNLTPYDAKEVVVKFNFDPLLEFLEGPPGAVYNSVNKEVTLSLSKLPALSNVRSQFKLEVPISIPLGTPINYTVSISTINEENNLLDNTYSWTRILRNSYDPNDKIGFPIGIGDQNSITQSDSVLTYQINFQNTGNDTAYVVVLRDSLDTNVFDIKSIETLESSHNFETEIVDNNVLIYNFQNINLPDSTTNLEESQGFVIFQIHLKKELPIGSQINNSAAIFFDYNPPIITNTVLHTIDDFTNTKNISPILNTLSVIPNPTRDFLKINFELTEKTNVNIRLLDIYGRQVQTLLKDQSKNIGSNRLIINNLDIPNGLYFLSFESEGQNFIEKIMVVK